MVKNDYYFCLTARHFFTGFSSTASPKMNTELICLYRRNWSNGRVLKWLPAMKLIYSNEKFHPLDFCKIMSLFSDKLSSYNCRNKHPELLALKPRQWVVALRTARGSSLWWEAREESWADLPLSLKAEPPLHSAVDYASPDCTKQAQTWPYKTSPNSRTSS